MKYILTLIAIVVAGSPLVFTGCNKTNDNSNVYSMKADVDTIVYNASNCIAINKGGVLVIEGLSGGSAKPVYPYMSITIAGWNNLAGVSYFDNTTSDSYAQYFINDTAAELSQTGSVAIYSVSDVSVKGTFYFTSTNGNIISNGTFIAALQ